MVRRLLSVSVSVAPDTLDAYRERWAQAWNEQLRQQIADLLYRNRKILEEDNERE